MDGPEPGPGAPLSRRRLAWAVGAAAAVVAIALVLVISSGNGHRSTKPTGTAPTSPTPTTPAPAAAPPGKPAPGTEQFGVSVNRLFNDGTYSAQQIDSQLAALRATGATIARSDALWEATEPVAPAGGAHHYDWSFDDKIAASLARHGLRWLPIIDYTAPWAESVAGSDHSAPTSAADFAAYAAAVAARYGPGGSFWSAHSDLNALPVDTFEIWNEPDSRNFWAPVPDPARYADLYTQSRNAILAVDASARVIIGGLAYPGVFLPALLSAAPGLRGHIDGVGIHPYASNALGVLATVGHARATLATLGLGSVPLYVTEFGWPTMPAHSQYWAPESLRPRYIQSTVSALGHTNCGVASAVLYTWVTPERDPANREDWFGIHSPTGADTPDARALTTGLRAAAASRPAFDVCRG
jgi:polysaccharide biosynthesis protein PslG